MISRNSVVALALSLAAHALLLGAGLPWLAALEREPEAELPQPFVVRAAIVPVTRRAVPAPMPAAPELHRPRLRMAAPEFVPVAAPALPDASPLQVATTADLVDLGVHIEPDASTADEVPPPIVEAQLPQAEAVLSLDGWPAQGRIVFRVLMGQGGLAVGEAQHEWWHDDERYRMRLHLRTTGIAALMRGFDYEQRSEGELGARGLRPLRFSVEQRGRRSESALFDWRTGRVSLRREDKERRAADIRPGDQDVLSLWHQIGIVGTEGLPTRLTVVSNKSAKPASLEAVGPERMHLPIGRLDTLHLRAAAVDRSLTIDIWLARDYGLLPVRIRITDDEGEVLDQQAIQLRLTPPGADTGIVPGGMIELSERRTEAEVFGDIYRN